METWRQERGRSLVEKEKNEMSDLRNCAEMSRRGGRKKCVSSVPGGQLFELGTLLSLKQKKITHHIEPNLQKMSVLVSYPRERSGKKLIKCPAPFSPHFTLPGAL